MMSAIFELQRNTGIILGLFAPCHCIQLLQILQLRFLMLFFGSGGFCIHQFHIFKQRNCFSQILVSVCPNLIPNSVMVDLYAPPLSTH